MPIIYFSLFFSFFHSCLPGGEQCPKDFAFYPRTWILPTEMGDFRTQFDGKGKSSKVFILKPDAGCQGRGIFLTQDVSKVLRAIVTLSMLVFVCPRDGAMLRKLVILLLSLACTTKLQLQSYSITHRSMLYPGSFLYFLPLHPVVLPSDSGRRSLRRAALHSQAVAVGRLQVRLAALRAREQRGASAHVPLSQRPGTWRDKQWQKKKGDFARKDGVG